ncbi:MAG: aldo/keto reductase [Oscillospiraceae bacterium]|jgi:aryl-alcohol dehydrogenase-like predicted oxidoreductase|nr:aldo/keto reductase [Oscillospiraceae bacterium]
MKTVTVSNGRHTLRMARIVVGDNGVSDPARQKFAHWCFDRYLELGGNCFDTARIYGGGRSEAALGAYLAKKPRDSYLVSTKCGHHDCGKPPLGRLSREEILSDADQSLRALGCGYADILFLHRDDIYKPVEEIMPVLHELVTAGKARVLGASNWTAGRIAAANEFAEKNGLTPFSVSQILYNLGLTTAAQTGDLTHVVMDGAEHSWYEENRFPVMAWTSTGKGFFAKTAVGLPMDPQADRYYGWLPENYRRAERAKALAERLGVPVSAVALSYVTSGPVPCAGVTAFSTEEQFTETMRAAELTLTQAQREYLEGKGECPV